jgi:hypothetical protein
MLRSSASVRTFLVCVLALATMVPWRAVGGNQANQPAVSAAELRAMGERAIANQHRDDDALETYERTEREIQTTSGTQPRVLSDKTYRVVPTGTGTLHLLLREGGAPVSAFVYRQELETWARTLEMAVDPGNSRIQGARDKDAARRRERTEMVDTVRQAYITTWLGHEMQDGYLCDKLQLEPNPDFQPPDEAMEILTHAQVMLWIDPKSGQVVRGDADILRDIPFGGGFLGKVYRGGHFVLKQRPVAPNIWLAWYYQYDFSGRKLMFSFEDHKKVEISRYRDLGSVSQALAVARSDISRAGTFSGDP